MIGRKLRLEVLLSEAVTQVQSVRAKFIALEVRANVCGAEGAMIEAIGRIQRETEAILSIKPK
ncbi:MAG TPA: hypothetical protein VIZ17_15770 [Acetobacteraceae bacterium]